MDGVFEYVISLLHVQLFSLTLSHCLSFCTFQRLVTSFSSDITGSYCFFIRRHDIFQFPLFHWFYCVFFFSSSTLFVKFFRTNFCYLLCFSKKSKQFPCKCEHWTESIYECRQPRCKTFTKWTNENVLWRRKYDATPQTNRLEQLAGVFCVVFFSSFIIFTNCFLSHIKLAVLL